MHKLRIVYHADWGSKPYKRRCAKAILGSDDRYTACVPLPVGDARDLLTNLRAEAGGLGTVFAGFVPKGIPAHYAKRAFGFLNYDELA